MKLKAGVIGFGVGEAHAERYESLPECELVAIADFDSDKREKAGKQFPSATIYKSADEILERSDIDLVSICSYDDHHYEQLLKAIPAGKHIFVEKPLCMYEHEAKEIRALLDDHPEVKLSSNLILRKSPRFMRLKKMIESGEIGNIYHMQGAYEYGRIHKIIDGWRGEMKFYSVILGGAVHIIDLFIWLAGERPVEVFAYGNNLSTRNTGFGFDDLVAGVMKFENTMVAQLTANFACVHPHFHPLNVYGDKGTFKNGMHGGKYFASHDFKIEPEDITEAYPGTHKGALIDSFTGSVTGGGKADVTADEVFDSISVCFAIDKSARIGKPVEVNYI